MANSKQIITVSPTDIDLYHVAARYWGDASAWLALATANGMTDPVITGIQTLVIPPYNPAYTGGVAPQ
jgi:hypothetical protein